MIVFIIFYERIFQVRQFFSVPTPFWPAHEILVLTCIIETSNEGSDRGLQCLPMSHKKDIQLV